MARTKDFDDLPDYRTPNEDILSGKGLRPIPDGSRPRRGLTDEQVEQEISRLKDSEFVKLSQKEERTRYARRQLLYGLRRHDKRGRELAAAGITMDILNRLSEE